MLETIRLGVEKMITFSNDYYQPNMLKLMIFSANGKIIQIKCIIFAPDETDNVDF